MIKVVSAQIACSESSSGRSVVMSSAKARTFDPRAFLAETGLGRTILQYPKNQVIFAQGSPSDAVFYIQAGRAKLTVLSVHGKEATIALLGEGDFMGEGCIAADQPLRTAFSIWNHLYCNMGTPVP
jgi:CRP/FNR family transcriptional regulator, cyclic AMP receptor protein